MSRRWSAAHPKSWILVALGVLLLNAWVIGHFHDRFWWAPDEGNYAHVAERILDGEVLHAEVQDIHPGYVNFTNAAAMAVFGRRMVSLRYPLALLGVAQCLLLFLILRPAGLFTAATGASAITALGFIQFLNPTAHWYCLFLVIALGGVLHLAPRDARWRLPMVGALVMLAVLFRQLSGVLIAMGVLTSLLLEDSASDPAPSRGPWLARVLVAVMLLGLVGYLARATDALGWVLFGVWPVLLLLHAARATRTPDERVLGMLAPLSVGAAIAALPLVVYHLAHGSFAAWYHDVIVTAIAFPRMPFFDVASHATLLADAIRAVASGSVRALVNGLFWIAATLVGAVVGGLVLRQLARDRSRGSAATTPALAVLAVFYGVVSVHYQIPIYLVYSVGLSVAALLLLRRTSVILPAAVAVMLPIAVVFHAGQPLSRGISGVAAGRRVSVDAAPGIARAGLRVEARDAVLYAALLDVIDRETPPDAAILALPSHAELYFLSGRRNPFPFFNSAFGITSDAELADVMATLTHDPPALVFHNPRDKYNTAATQAIMAHVTATWDALPPIGGIAIYRRPLELVQLPRDPRRSPVRR